MGAIRGEPGRRHGISPATAPSVLAYQRECSRRPGPSPGRRPRSSRPSTPDAARPVRGGRRRSTRPPRRRRGRDPCRSPPSVPGAASSVRSGRGRRGLGPSGTPIPPPTRTRPAAPRPTASGAAWRPEQVARWVEAEAEAPPLVDVGAGQIERRRGGMPGVAQNGRVLRGETCPRTPDHGTLNPPRVGITRAARHHRVAGTPRWKSRSPHRRPSRPRASQLFESLSSIRREFSRALFG